MSLGCVSATQVEAFRKCPRKWYYGWPLGKKQPETPAMRRGTAFHKVLETYLRTGELVPDAEFPEVLGMAQAALEYLPQPQSPGLLLEQEIALGTWEGGPVWVGFIDLVETEIFCRVTDHKSRSDPKYDHSAEELRSDTQLASYAKWVFSVSDYEQIALRHLNIHTRGRPRPNPVEITVDRAWAEQIWLRDLDSVRLMADLVEASPDPQDIPCSPDECSAYGGCYYQNLCGPCPRVRSDSMADPTKNNILSRIRASAAEKLAASAPASAPPASAAAAPSAPASAPPAAAVSAAPARSGVLDRLRKPAPSAAPPPAPPTAPPAGRAPLPDGCGFTERLASSPHWPPAPAPPPAPPTAGVLPPDAPPRTSTAEEVAVANAPAPEKTRKKASSSSSVSLPTIDATAFELVVTTRSGQRWQITGKLVE